MFSFTHKGSFEKTDKFLNAMTKANYLNGLEQYGAQGVNALASATPRDSGITATSWTYEIVRKGSRYSIIWHNTNVKSGIPIAIILQYGHGTGTGGWVEGRDYINPAIQPIMDKIANVVWEQVQRG